jgi:hypothetical protein
MSYTHPAAKEISHQDSFQIAPSERKEVAVAFLLCSRLMFEVFLVGVVKQIKKRKKTSKNGGKVSKDD